MPHHGYASKEEAVGKAVKDLEFDLCGGGNVMCDLCEYVSSLEVLILKSTFGFINNLEVFGQTIHVTHSVLHASCIKIAEFVLK